MYNQMMNNFNVGGTKIDARLQSNIFAQGDAVQGQVLLANSGYAQEVGELYLRIYTMSGSSHKGKVAEIAAFKLANSFVVQPNQQTSFPFQIQLPFNAPTTTFGGGQRVWLRTTLDTPAAYDPTDDDYIEVRLNPLKERILNAIQRMGLQLFKVDCEESGHGHSHHNPQMHHQQNFNQPYGHQPPMPNQNFGSHPYPNQPMNQPYGNQSMPNQPYGNQPPGYNQAAFNPPNFNQQGYQNQVVNGLMISSNNRLVQEFEFRPAVPQYRGLDELEVVFNQWNPNELEMMLQIDRKHKGFFSGDERTVRTHVNAHNFNETNFMYGLDNTLRSWIR